MHRVVARTRPIQVKGMNHVLVIGRTNLDYGNNNRFEALQAYNCMIYLQLCNTM